MSADAIDPNAKLSYTDDYQLGFEREVVPNTSIGIRYTYRNIGRVLEDVAAFPVVAYDLGVPGTGSVEYILTNPSSATPVAPRAAFLGATFDDPVHKYQAVELTMQRRFVDNWSLLGIVPMVETARKLRGLLQGRQRTIGSRDHIAVRLSHQRSELYRHRRPAVRVSRRHPVPGRCQRHPAARSSASVQGVRQLRIPDGTGRRRRTESQLRRAADAAGRQPELHERW